jgi:phage shock protein E
MHRLPARAIALFFVAVLVAVVAACGGSSAGSAGATVPGVQKVTASKAVGMLASRTVIDVRTPAEYAAGHIAGAQNDDVEAADFGSRIAALDKKAPYLVYCHSGRRSGIAATQMATAGFADIVDGGAMADLVAAGARTQP